MSLKFESVEVISFRPPPPVEPDGDPILHGWADVRVNLHDGDTDSYPGFHANVPVSFGPDSTLADVENQAISAVQTMILCCARHFSSADD